MVMEEMPQPRDTFVLMRGQYDKHGEKVTAGVARRPAAAARRRPGQPPRPGPLARRPGAPADGRVTVNRFWQMFFGTGLVKTAEDFGSQGEPPSHPELLDWLAVEFVRPQPGWRRLGRQGAGAADRHLGDLPPVVGGRRRSSGARDPENRLLARGPRLRLQAEFIRDQALAVSGLLNGEIGGASVSPYQPPGLWEELTSRGRRRELDGPVLRAEPRQGPLPPHDVHLLEADLARRRRWPPSTPPTARPAPSAAPRTNTPLQALVLMNDPTYVEAARKLAERMMTEAETTG